MLLSLSLYIDLLCYSTVVALSLPQTGKLNQCQERFSLQFFEKFLTLLSQSEREGEREGGREGGGRGGGGRGGEGGREGGRERERERESMIL